MSLQRCCAITHHKQWPYRRECTNTALTASRIGAEIYVRLCDEHARELKDNGRQA